MTDENNFSAWLSHLRSLAYSYRQPRNNYCKILTRKGIFFKTKLFDEGLFTICCQTSKDDSYSTALCASSITRSSTSILQSILYPNATTTTPSEPSQVWCRWCLFFLDAMSLSTDVCANIVSSTIITTLYDHSSQIGLFSSVPSNTGSLYTTTPRTLRWP